MHNPHFKEYMQFLVKDYLPPPTKEQEVRLFKNLPDSLDEIVRRYKPLVMQIALKYAKNDTDRMVDLFQEGLLGVLKATEKFDLSLGHRFSTYAVHWIEQFVRRCAYDHFSDIHYPEYIRTAVNHYFDTGEVPDNITNEDIAEIVRNIGDAHWNITTSVDGNWTDPEDRHDRQWRESLTTEEVIDPAIDLIESETMSRIRRCLSDREFDVLVRYIVDGETLQSIGNSYSLSRERIRQVRDEVIKKLRSKGPKILFDEDFNQSQLCLFEETKCKRQYNKLERGNEKHENRFEST